MSVRFSASGSWSSSGGLPAGSTQTVLFWYSLAADTGTWQEFFRTNSGGASHFIETRIDGTNFTFSGGGGEVGNFASSLNTWYCVAVVVSGTSVTVYHGTDPDGLSTASGSCDALSATGVVIGNAVNGRMAALTVHEAVLTAAEIAVELGQYKPTRRAGLLRFHPWLSADTVDYSGNGVNLTGSPTIATEDGPPIRWAPARSSRVGSSGPKVLALVSVPSAESVGIPSLTQIIAPLAVPTAESVGIPMLGQVIRPTSVASAAAVGTPSVVRLGTIDLVAVPSAESVGAPVLVPGPVTVQLLSVPSAESVGTPIVTIVIDLAKLVRRGRIRRVPKYELLVMRRVQQPAGPPIFTDVAAMTWMTLGWGSTLSRPQSLSVKLMVSSVGEQIAQRLRRPDRLATELWLLRDGAQVFAGPWMTGSRDGAELTINASGLLVYLQGMFVRADMRFDQLDQFTIAAQLIDQWQSQPYFHFGIDTSAVGASGQLRDGSYIRNEKNWVGQRIEELGARRNGFDSEIDPTTRRLQLWSPRKGVDRSVGEDKVVFDRRNTGGENSMFSIAPGDLASIAIGTSTASGSDTTLWSEQVNDDLLRAYGGFAVSGSWSKIEDQATLDEHVGALLDDRDQPLRSPGRKVRVTPDSPLTGYDVGDTVDFTIDSLLGVGGPFRLRSRYVNVERNGTELVDVEFV